MDSLRQELQEQEILTHKEAVAKETYKLLYEEKEREYEALKTKFDKLQLRVQDYNHIDFPSIPLATIESKIKFIDPYVAETLVEYLNLDSYELVKNLAQTVNSSNAANVIAYRDGALGRNLALIKRLKSIKQVSYQDKMTGDMKHKK